MKEEDYIQGLDILIDHYRTLPLNFGAVFLNKAHERKQMVLRRTAANGLPELPQIASDGSVVNHFGDPIDDTHE